MRGVTRKLGPVVRVATSRAVASAPHNVLPVPTLTAAGSFIDTDSEDSRAKSDMSHIDAAALIHPDSSVRLASMTRVEDLLDADTLPAFHAPLAAMAQLTRDQQVCGNVTGTY